MGEKRGKYRPRNSKPVSDPPPNTDTPASPPDSTASAAEQTPTPPNPAPVVDGQPAIKKEAPKDMLADVIARQNVKRGQPGHAAKTALDKEKEKKKEAVVLDPALQEISAECVAELETEALTAWTGDESHKEKSLKILKAGWLYYLKVTAMPALPGWLILIMSHLAVGFGTERKPIFKKFSGLMESINPKKTSAPSPSTPSKTNIVEPSVPSPSETVSANIFKEPDLTPPTNFNAKES